MSDRMLSPKATAQILGIGVRKLKHLVQTGVIASDAYILIPSTTGNSKYDRVKFDPNLVKQSLRDHNPNSKPKEQIIKELEKDFICRYGLVI